MAMVTTGGGGGAAAAAAAAAAAPCVPDALPHASPPQNLKFGSVAMAQANLASSVLGNCFWMGTS